MNDAAQGMVAQGSLARTPFAHLILYLYQRRSSGTLCVRAAGQETKVLVHRGRAVAADLAVSVGALDEGLLSLCECADGSFIFYDSDDLVGSGPSILTGMFDPFAFVAEAARRYPRPELVQDILGKFACVPVSLQPTVDVTRLMLTPSEAQLTQQLSHSPATIEALAARSPLDTETTRRLLYVLLITRILAPHVAGAANSQDASAQSASSPARPGRPSTSSMGPSIPGGARASDRSHASGATWRAIAMRAGQMSSKRPPSSSVQPAQPVTVSASDEQPDTAGSAPAGRPISRPLMPSSAAPAGRRRSASQPISRPLTPSPASGRVRPERPISRPLTPHPSAVNPSRQPGSRSPSRPLTPAPFGGSTRPSPSSPISRVTPRPSPTPVEMLDAAGKLRRVEQLCQRHAYEEALPIIRGLVEEDHKSAKYLGVLSHVLLGRVTDNAIGKEIVEAVNQALRIDPDEVHALYTKARCYKRMGKEREALHYFRRTVAVDPQHLDAAREVRLLLLRMSEKRKR